MRDRWRNQKHAFKQLTKNTKATASATKVHDALLPPEPLLQPRRIHSTLTRESLPMPIDAHGAPLSL